MNKAVFIDRDGTINRNVHYCSRPDDFELLSGVGEAIKLLNDNGFEVVIVTNQSGIARGYFTEQTLTEIHQKMMDELSRYGARIDGIYYCPHGPDDGCDCRKPKLALFHRAANEMDIDFSKSYVVGDSDRDIEAGRALGCTTILITTDTKQGTRSSASPDYVAGNFTNAVNWIK